jgi:hypothetical protein
MLGYCCGWPFDAVMPPSTGRFAPVMNEASSKFGQRLFVVLGIAAHRHRADKLARHTEWHHAAERDQAWQVPDPRLGLRHLAEFKQRRFKPRARPRLPDRGIDATAPRAVHPAECYQVPAAINDRDPYCDVLDAGTLIGIR